LLGVSIGGVLASPPDEVEVLAGGNGIALGAVAAWFAIRRAEAGAAVDRDYDRIGVVVSAAVLLALPLFESTADPVVGVVGGLVGGIAGFLAAQRGGG
jgi:hypothetical protein